MVEGGAVGNKKARQGSSCRAFGLRRCLVAIVSGFVGSFDRDAEVLGLIFGQLGELDADLLQVQAGDFFVESLRQYVHCGFVEGAVLPEIQRR